MDVEVLASAFNIFQSTLPRGERLLQCLPLRSKITISIHAPTRGATHYFRMVCVFSLFQSTLPRGERPIILLCQIGGDKFQSTLPRGERHVLFVSNMPDLVFQSTLPRGERHDVFISSLRYFFISIHAPTRGATWKFQW